MKKNAPWIEAGFANPKAYKEAKASGTLLVNQNNQPVVAVSYYTAKQIRQALNENNVKCDNVFFLAESKKNERIWVCLYKKQIVSIAIDGEDQVRFINEGR